MALKITASGWPNDVLKSDNPDRAKQEFVIRNELEYGIKLDPSKIALNEGMRFTTKVCASAASLHLHICFLLQTGLNSFWDKCFLLLHFFEKN